MYFIKFFPPAVILKEAKLGEANLRRDIRRLPFHDEGSFQFREHQLQAF
jgi:hypothetical protein